MIYIFKACGAVCTAPWKICDAGCVCCGQACSSCTSACNTACKTICWPCTVACKRISEFFGTIANNPLGGYVLWTFASAIFVVCGAAISLTRIAQSSKAEGDCESSKVLCIVMMGIAAVHAGFAFYIQRRLVAEIAKEDSKNMTSTEIVAKAKHVMLYDVIFCLYSPFFLGAWAYVCYSFAAFESCKEFTGPAWGAAALLVCYGFVASNYLAWWFCCQCCCATAESVRGVQGSSQPQVLVPVPPKAVGAAAGEAAVAV